MRKKITIVGAGNVGGTLAQRLAERNYADLVLVDVVEGLPQGKALDLMEAGPLVGYDCEIIGTNSYEQTAHSDIAIITSGVARKPGMSRDDLLFTNMEIVKSVTQNIVKFSPNCILILISNPLDAMTQLAFHVSGFPKHRVLGMAGVLDTARFRTFLSWEGKVSVTDTYALVLGGHGDTMVPMPRYSTVAGVPIPELFSKETLARLIERTQNGGAEVVKLLKTGSAFYAPSAAAAQMVDAILLDQKKILPCSVYLEGEYGIDRLFVGVPAKLGSSGVEEIAKMMLSVEEQVALQKSAQAVKELIDLMLTKGGMNR
ncbi:MAG: malate dehydrogenase [Candidatus Eremiobacteraeota bacterium]|nr:malate dehydrogenase [Candidatus Eremiobacteraeota bacterium]